MNRNNKLASQLAVGLALATLFGTSAFAESRHSNETGSQGRIHRGGEARSETRSSEPRSETRSSDRRSDASSFRNRDESRNDASATRNWDRNRNNDGNRSSDRNRSYDNNNRNYDRNRTYDNNNRNYDRNRSYDNNRSYDRNRSYDNSYRDHRRYDSNRYDSHRYDNRRYDYRGNDRRYDRHVPYYSYGRVSRLERYGGGYRVWVGGSLYPFFVPEVRFRLFPLRIGLNIRIGGYYNPIGYYDYYDVGPYSNAPIYTSGDLHGVVESVDYRRGTAVLRDDISGSFVTVLLTSGDRLMDDLRPGDYVDFSGAWSRNGVFEAYRVAGLNDDGYRRY